MSITTGIVTFIIVWWVSLFLVLPFGVRGQWEEGQVKNGSEPGAPIKPLIIRKFFITTGIAVIFWVVVYVIITTNALQLISFDWLFGTPATS
jgi:predicted secreted protein